MTTLVREREALAVPSEAPPKDRALRWLTVVATTVAIISFVYFDHQGTILAYKDAISHMEIARRVVDSPTTGFGQLGGVWLPLPHILMLPFVWNNTLYYDGLAGSLTSMACYVITTRYLYLIVRDLTGKVVAGLAAAVVFMANPNILYMQATPMTELLLFACMAGMVYYVQRWIQTEDKKYLIWAGITAFLGSLARYEAWVLLAALVVVIITVAVAKRFTREKTEGITLAFVFVGGLGILAWIVWNLLIFGNPLNFQDGQYAKPSLWVGNNEPSVGHIRVAANTYWIATADNLRLFTVVLAVIGLVVLVVRERLALRSLPSLSLLVMVPFFVLALYKGQRPLHVSQISGNLYNVRFGLLMILPAAIFIGYLVGTVPSKFVAIPVVAVIAGLGTITVTSLMHPATIVDLQEAVVDEHNASTQNMLTAAQYMRSHYHGGRILMQSYSNDLLLPKARISLRNDIYEGSYKLWGPALKDPVGKNISWIIMRHTAGSQDEVYTKLYTSPALADYRQVYHNDDYFIYVRGTDG